MQLVLSFQNLSSNVHLPIRKRFFQGFKGFANRFRHGETWRNPLAGFAISTGHWHPIGIARVYSGHEILL